MISRFFFFFFLAFTFFSCTSNTEKINQLKWLEGTWEREFNGVTQIENWKFENHQLKGESIFSNQTQQTVMSYSNISEQNSKIILARTQQGFESPTAYSISYFNIDSVVFKTTESVWPTTITLVKKTDEIYIQSLSGRQQQMFNEVHFKYDKEK
ncbi:MAG: hypothetical protein ACPGRC_09525 [Salibacteraceae bacterium]